VNKKPFCYFAVGDGPTAVRHLVGLRALVSYAYVTGTDNWIKPKQLTELAQVTAGIMIDSGAFTVWKKGIAVSLDQYLGWLSTEAPAFEWALGLDVIGDAAASLKNYELARAKEPRIVPVWHEGDPLEHLEHYCETSRLVALGRVEARDSEQKTFAFYDSAFNAQPDAEFHALGNGSPPTLEPYPFYSFDSTGWQRDSVYTEAARWPLCRASKDTRRRVYIEAMSSIEHVPRKQDELFGWKPQVAKNDRRAPEMPREKP
jgi:hypothetical protein